MVKYPFALVFAALVAPATLPALDLTPATGSRQLEGFEVPVVTFSDGAQHVRWQPPSKWQISGGQQKLVLSPPDFAQATMELHVIPRQSDARDRIATPAERQTLALRFLPGDAVEIMQAAENSSPFTLRGQPSSEIIFQYSSQARRLASSISFVDLNPRERLVLTVTARQADFASVRESAMASMFSFAWQE